MENTPAITNQTILVWGTAMMLFLTTVIVMFIYLFQRKLIKRKLAYQKIENLLSQQELKSAYSLLEGQDIERQRIAEEIHDNLGSVLATLSMYAHALQKETVQEEKQKYEARISDITQQAIREVRKISHRLDASALRYVGLTNAIQDLINAVNETGAVKAMTSLQLPATLPAELSINLYRILQELLNNTLKHANASEVSLDITTVDKTLSFIYEDNGSGFSTDMLEQKGMGLRNITARVEKLNGSISFERKPTNGFSTVLEIPLT
jgi:two-component system, NarL family, sensor kinase